MNPLLPGILKLLPKLLPQLIPLVNSLVNSLVAKQRPTERPENRLHELEDTLERLAARSQDLERRMKQVRTMSILSVLLSLGVLVAVLVRS
jgi:hypothetical protein